MTALIAAVLGLAFLPSPGFSQARPLCFRASPPGSCRSFVVLEVAGRAPFAHTPRWVTSEWTDLETGEPRSQALPARELSHAVAWDVGFGVNVAERWAAGMTVGYGLGEASRLSSLGLLARRWLTPDLAIDVTPSVFRLRETGLLPDEDRTGWSLGARASLWGIGFVGARYVALPLDSSTSVDGAVRTFDPGGTEEAWFAEAGLSGTAAAVTSGLGLLALLVALGIGLGGVG